MKPIALIGLRGTGKTTVGRRLAELLGGGFVDTDELLTTLAGRSIATIFATEGEAAFRRLESHAIGEALAHSPSVLSLGGGSLVRDENVALLADRVVFVWLTAPPATLAARVLADPSSALTRPALTGATLLEELLDLQTTRTGRFAALASLVVDTTSISPGDVADFIRRELQAKGPAFR